MRRWLVPPLVLLMPLLFVACGGCSVKPVQSAISAEGASNRSGGFTTGTEPKPTDPFALARSLDSAHPVAQQTIGASPGAKEQVSCTLPDGTMLNIATYSPGPMD